MYCSNTLVYSGHDSVGPTINKRNVNVVFVIHVMVTLLFLHRSTFSTFLFRNFLK